MRLAPRCPRCGLAYEREEGYWLGAILINTALTIGLFGAGMIGWAIATWPDPPWGVMTAAGIGFNLLFPAAFYPYSKTLWVAIEITLHPPGASPATRYPLPASAEGVWSSDENGTPPADG